MVKGYSQNDPGQLKPEGWQVKSTLKNQSELHTNTWPYNIISLLYNFSSSYFFPNTTKECFDADLRK